MNIKLEQLIPFPLKERDLSNSQIWNRSFELENGISYQIQAASGTGKSTFLQIIYGNRKDFEGKVFIEGKDSAKLGVNDWASLRKNRFSIVFQDLRLFSELSAVENLKLKFHLESEHSWEKIENMIEKLGVAHLLDRKAKHLSYGERQRFAIIRALISPFEWLLLDEPFSHLDKANAKKAAELIQENCKERNAGMLVAGLDEDAYFNYDKTLLL
ncbi:MAG: ATP-binding cassette domain-containing protein [Chitinophagales bacterium]